MRSYDVWFPRYALRNRPMFFCRLFSPAAHKGLMEKWQNHWKNFFYTSGNAICSILLKCQARKVDNVKLPSPTAGEKVDRKTSTYFSGHISGTMHHNFSYGTSKDS